MYYLNNIIIYRMKHTDKVGQNMKSKSKHVSNIIKTIARPDKKGKRTKENHTCQANKVLPRQRKLNPE